MSEPPDSLRILAGRALLSGAIHMAAFFLAQAGAVLFFDSNCRVAYGALSGWWASLYVGYVFRIGMTGLVGVLLISTALVFLAAYSIVPIPYSHDLGGGGMSEFLRIWPAAVTVYVTPSIINTIIRAVITRFVVQFSR